MRERRRARAPRRGLAISRTRAHIGRATRGAGYAGARQARAVDICIAYLCSAHLQCDALSMAGAGAGWGTPGATVRIVTAGGEGDVMEMGGVTRPVQRLEAGSWEMCVGATVA